MELIGFNGDILMFDAATGWLAIAGNANNNIVKQTITGNGYSNVSFA